MSSLTSRNPRQHIASLDSSTSVAGSMRILFDVFCMYMLIIRSQRVIKFRCSERISLLRVILRTDEQTAR